MKSFHLKAFSILPIICLGTIVYSNTFFCSFHFDDLDYIVNNYALRNIRDLPDIWNFCPCRFITFLSLAINYHFYGLNVFGYHLFNLAVHLGSAVLVWWLFMLTFSTPVMKEEKISRYAPITSLLAALLFVSHPAQTEAVTYIWQRAACLAALFYLASLCLYVKSRLSGGSRPYYILSLITAVIAMFTKENAITLPLMVLLYEISFFKSKKDMNWARLYPFWVILFIIPQTMFLTKSTRFQEIHSIIGGPSGVSPTDYLLTQCRVMLTYIRLAFLPLNLNLDYDYPVYKSLFEIPVLAGLLTIAAILYFAKCMISKYRLISFSIFWFFLTLLPESSIVPQTDVIFEHRLYLPMVGFCMFLTSSVYYAFVACRHSEPEGRMILRYINIFLIIIIAFYSILTYQRNKIWINEMTLWEDVVQKSPNKARGYINRGWAYFSRGNTTKALSDLDKAAEINPELIYPYDKRGLIYAQQGNFSRAISEYNKAIRINHYYPQVYCHRGHAFFMQKNYSQALSDYNKTIEIDPEYVDAYNERAKLCVIQGNLAQAKSDHTRSITIDPNQTEE